jgi:hypothetical protein
MTSGFHWGSTTESAGKEAERIKIAGLALSLCWAGIVVIVTFAETLAGFSKRLS